MNRLLQIFILFSLFAASSCEMEDEAVVLPPPGELTKGVADIGSLYDKQVFYTLSTGAQVTRSFKSYDLAFEASADGFHVYLNTGKLMFACRTGSYDIATADTIGKTWFTDNDHLDDDSAAINSGVVTSANTSQVYVIDRGKPVYLFNWTERLRKLLIKEVTPTSYTIQFSKYNNTELTTYTITKDTAYSLMYFNFDNGGQMVQMAPPKDQWDFVFTPYTHTFYEEPINSPYRYYLVNGGLINRWSGITGTILKDSLANYIPFSDFKYSNVSSYNFVPHADVIGYGWKVYDFNSSSYIIIPNVYYVIRTAEGLYYKIRFIDFYNPQTGEKGYITFEFQRI